MLLYFLLIEAFEYLLALKKKVVFKMTSKMLALFTIFCSLSACFGSERSTKHLYHIDIPIEAMEAMDGASSIDLKEEKPAPPWRFWRPWKFWQWGRSMLNERFSASNSADLMESASGRLHRDFRFNNEGHSKRTITQRESSLILPQEGNLGDGIKTLYAHSTVGNIDTGGIKTKGSVQREIITLFFESMLDTIVASWEIIEQSKKEKPGAVLGKASSELTIAGKKKKSIAKQTKTKISRSKIELFDSTQTDSLQQCWWSSPDERAIIHFRNGNIYEGNISMKCMHGEGRFQWADGTIYFGQFKNNEMNGKGVILWKDDTWYQGDFVNNLRHGKGLYVDSREQRSYYGHWDLGTKHGKGKIYYSSNFKNSYDGVWLNNVRHGFGSREYCASSGYRGNWEYYIREGDGLMIWPNHDFFRGCWKNNLMSGHGVYIWNAYYNNSMSLPSLIVYRGDWEKGKRHGFGEVNFGFGLGSYYKGEFKHNKKHGAGKLVTNNGLVIQDRHLFIDDNIGAINDLNVQNLPSGDGKTQIMVTCQFDMYNKLGLLYHIQQALQNIDRQVEIRRDIINDYLLNNGMKSKDVISTGHNTENENINFNDMVEFEISLLQKAIKYYESFLRNVYYQYATICNREEIYFTPILSRLYLWQLYYDCNIHEKGLTLIQIDDLLYKNPEFLAKKPHDPFEKIYFWQFIHSLILVASHFYAQKNMPQKKPDTIVASAFRFFMEQDVIPGVGGRKGRLSNGYGHIIPLKPLYKVYLSLGEVCTIRTFLRAIRYPTHEIDRPQIAPVDREDITGRNTYLYDDEILFMSDNPTAAENLNTPHLKLFNLNNVPSKSIINIFSKIFPHVRDGNKVLDLNKELTFFEFFEAFADVAEESVIISKRDVKAFEEKKY